MSPKKIYSLQEIRKRLQAGNFPFTGITELGTAIFKFLRPSFYAGTAIHAGSRIRAHLCEALEINIEDRYREEDPKTEFFIKDFPIQIIANDSRFEYDINRNKDNAIYKTPDMAWGLKVWKRPLTQDEMDISITKHHEFHQLMDIVSDYLIKQNNFGIIFDLHSYNYQRDDTQPWYINKKPAINIGTKYVNRAKFSGIINELIDSLSKISIDGHLISVAENEVFKGGYLAQRLSAVNYNQLLVLAIEFKKLFMNELTGKFYQTIFKELVNKFSQVVNKNMVTVSKVGIH